ncbi:hypothetical protein GGX14DRAFT_406632 [Mycena pura]|uniref:Uncharacterized protein n=1 Tax=Mycena pura TaxID=153505 RepID=A0AAD6UWV0_9AGAR|nr:hypothetical protein GGX14DRAFT_406632 [Mycena pura]
MSRTVLKIILDATDKKISTELLSHIGAALNLSISGKRSLRFKFRSALQEHLKSLVNDDPEIDTCSAVADFFDSFENHRKPTLLAMAALHQIDVADHTSSEQLRQKITDHLISGACTRLSGVEVECDDETGNDLNVPDCAAVCDEWQKDSGDLELHLYVLSAIYDSRISRNSLRRVLSSLNIQFDTADRKSQLHQKLKERITQLTRGKTSAFSAEQKIEARRRHAEQLQTIHNEWAFLNL